MQIHDLQGCSHTSPYNGKKVKNIRGVVTHKVSNGFTMQSINSDEESCSSEAIFVFTNSFPDVLPGDYISVDGQVSEFTAGSSEDHNLSTTEINNPVIKVLQEEFELPKPIILDDQMELIPKEIIENDQLKSFDIDQDGLDYFESLESMLVEVKNATVVAARNSYNEIVVLPNSFTSKNVVSKEGALLNSKTDQNPEKIMVKLPTTYDKKVNVGDTLASPLIGIMDYSYGNYKLLSLSAPEFFSKQIVTEGIGDAQKNLSVVNYNLENLSPFDNEKRFNDFAGQIVDQLNSPDIIVLHEVMDNSGSVDDGTVDADKTIEKLIYAIEEKGGPRYLYSDPKPQNNQEGGIEGGNIRSVLLYRNDKGIQLANADQTVKKMEYQNGRFLVHDNPMRIAENNQSFSGTRKPELWLLEYGGNQFFVIGVHLVSQGANSPEWGNAQPPLRPEEAKRINQAQIIHEEIKDILSMNPQAYLLVAGDMNDYPWSETIAALQGDLLVNSGLAVDPEEQYSYIFEGNAQQLDYIFINKNLAGNIAQARFVHLNTIFDWKDQVSDHDPVYLGLNFNP